MGNIILYMQMSLDGVVSDLERWMQISDRILEDALDYYDTLDTVMVGGNTYLSMAEYWHHAEKSSPSPLERAFAQKINEIKKVVITHSNMDLVWNNSQQLLMKDRETFIRDIERLKHQSEGKQISVESGIRTWRLFLQNALFDEMRLFVHPVVAGQGEKLFNGMEPMVPMRLKSSETFDNDVVLLHYQKK